MATFNVTRRDAKGEKPHQLRRRGIIPMVVIDREHKGHPVQAASDAIKRAIKGADSHGMIDLQIEGDPGIIKAMVKAIDNDPLARQIVSVTLQEVHAGDTVKTDVPIVATGHIAESNGGENTMLTAVTTTLHIRAKVSDLPEQLEVDVSKIGLGEHFSASDLVLPAGVELLSSPDVILFTVSRIAAPVLESDDTEKAADGEAQAGEDSGIASA